MNLENEYGMFDSGWSTELMLKIMRKWDQTEEAGCLSSNYDDVKIFISQANFAQ